MGLKERHPDCEIVLAVHKRFQEVCEGFPFVDTILSFDSDGLKDTILQGGDGLLQSYHYVKSFIGILRGQRFDLVYNLSHSRSSCILLSLLNIPYVVGSSADRTGTLCTQHPWANHFKNMTLNRETSAFNLVDVYRRMGEVPSRHRRLVYEVPPSARTAADRLLSDMFGLRWDGQESPLLIALQPGASQESRQWPASAFAKLAQALCDELGARIIVVGTDKEAPLGEGIVNACRGRAVSAMGKTSIAELAALLQRCRLLVTNDTGTMHLACAVDSQVVSLFMGPALFHQTGPYGEGHIVLQAEIPCAPCNYLIQCSHQICKEHIRWDAVLQVVKWVLAGKPPQVPDPLPGLGTYRSGFDEDGYLQFSPLSKRPLEWPALLRLAYREAWKVILDDKPLAEACETVAREIEGRYDYKSSLAEMANTQQETSQDLDRLYSLAQQGRALALELVEQASRYPPPVGRMQTLGKSLAELDEHIRILGATNDAVKPITATFRFSKENLEGWELYSLAQQTQQLYEELARQARTMAQLIAVCMAEVACVSSYAEPMVSGYLTQNECHSMQGRGGDSYEAAEETNNAPDLR
jgi:ADP-heptose:LPS heptosyltransferase